MLQKLMQENGIPNMEWKWKLACTVCLVLSICLTTIAAELKAAVFLNPINEVY
jgi:hypothetical protein